MVNSWYDENANRYIEQVLESKMGSHQDQSRVFDLLDMEKKINFFKQVISNCICRPRGKINLQNFRNDFTGFSDPDCITDPDIPLGNKVLVMETRPLSKDKRWRLVEIVEKAK